MTIIKWGQGMLRHTGYALLLLGGVLVLLEWFIPGFASPYLNIYLLTISGLILALLGGWGERPRPWTRLILGIPLVCTIGAFFLEAVTAGTSTDVLGAATAFLLFAILGQSMYANDV